MSDLATPIGECRDRTSQGWWRPILAQYGGRESRLVVEQTGQARVYSDSGQYTGHTEINPVPYVPTDSTIWLVDTHNPNGSIVDPWAWAEAVREADIAVVHEAGQYGLCGVRAANYERVAWRIAYGHLLLGYTPPPSLFLEPTPADWAIGREELGTYAARRVKRALLTAITEERRTLALAAKAVRSEWV